MHVLVVCVELAGLNGVADSGRHRTVPKLLTYRQIADDMAVRISTGEYAPGEKLPTYRELAVLYSVSVTTAARAYAVLVDRDVVVGMTGRGMFVPD